MNDYIDQLIREAVELEKDYYSGAEYGRHMYPSNPLSLARWKQHVLQVLGSFGENNPYYKDLITIEKDCSASMPRTVFSFFIETLKKARQFPPNGFSWPIPPVSPPGITAEQNKKEPETEPGAIKPEKHSEQVQESSAKTAKEPPTDKTSEDDETSLTVPAARHAARQREEKTQSRASTETIEQLDLEAREIYSRLLAETREIIIQSDNPYAKKHKNIPNLCALSLETLKTNPLLLTHAAFFATENYIYAHAVNVTILSQAIALDYGLSQDDTLLLSFCAMVNDLGMTEFQELYSKREYLNDAEFSRITLHVEAGITKLERIADINPGTRERAGKIIRQTHERVDASGYPLKLSGKEIDLLAQIIGVADTYEAMTHPRFWRESSHPCDVIKQFIEGDRRFELKVLKSLLRALSIYPPSSLVELSSGKIARVVMSRKGLLTRPIVEVLLGSNFAPIQPYVLDLSASLIHHTIERHVTIRELEEKNPEFAAKLESARWWEKKQVGSM